MISVVKHLSRERAAKVLQIFGMCKILGRKMQLCSHKLIFMAKGLAFTQLCERTFEGAPFYGGGGRKYYKYLEYTRI